MEIVPLGRDSVNLWGISNEHPGYDLPKRLVLEES